MTRRCLPLLLLVAAGCTNNTVVVVQQSSTVPVTATASSTGPSTSPDIVEFMVSGTAMMSALQDGDTMVVDRSAYLSSAPMAGDVVVFDTVESSGTRTLVKRIVGLPGDTLEYSSCQLFVNNQLVVESYLDPTLVTPTTCGVDQPRITLPSDGYFVLGDNRGASKDSRDLGPVPLSDIVGKVILVVTPSGEEHTP